MVVKLEGDEGPTGDSDGEGVVVKLEGDEGPTGDSDGEGVVVKLEGDEGPTGVGVAGSGFFNSSGCTGSSDSLLTLIGSILPVRSYCRVNSHFCCICAWNYHRL